jgi:hypothetical protein
VVDLNDVTFIDENGERLLSEMGSAGAEFVATGVATKHLLRNLKVRGERPLRRLIGEFPPGVCTMGAGGAGKLQSPCRSGESSFDLTAEEDGGAQPPDTARETSKKEKK